MTESQEGSNVTAQQQFDQERSEAFAGGMVKGPNSGAMARARGEKAETVISKDGTPIAYRCSGEKTRRSCCFPKVVQTDKAPKVRFSATLGQEPEVEVALV